MEYTWYVQRQDRVQIRIRKGVRTPSLSHILCSGVLLLSWYGNAWGISVHYFPQLLPFNNRAFCTRIYLSKRSPSLETVVCKMVLVLLAVQKVKFCGPNGKRCLRGVASVFPDPLKLGEQPSRDSTLSRVDAGCGWPWVMGIELFFSVLDAHWE